MKATLKTIIVALSLPTAASGPVRAAEGPTWYGKPDCRIAPVDVPPIDELRWRGPCKDGYAEGRGVLEWRGHDRVRQRLEATLVRGEIQGEASRKGDDGSSYVGSFARGFPHGQGYLRSAAGQYEGEFVGGKREGQGIFVTPAGDRYEGQWKDDEPEGTGRMTYALGGSYEGEWQQGRRHGRGVLVYAGSGRRYLGDFVDDRQAGAPPLPDPAAGQYAMKEDEPLTGTNIRSSIASGAPVPLHLGYAQLTPGQRQLVNARFPALEEGDEPPYPLGGMKRFYSLVSQAVGHYEAQGKLIIHVLVGADGRPVSVTGKGLEDQPTGDKMRYFGAAAAMSLQYKPALCRGKPCEMLFPFYLDLELTR